MRQVFEAINARLAKMAARDTRKAEGETGSMGEREEKRERAIASGNSNLLAALLARQSH